MKKAFILTTLLATITSSTVPNIMLVSNNVTNTSTNDLKNIKQQSQMIDFEQLMKDAAAATFKKLAPVSIYRGPTASNLKYENFNMTDVEISPNCDPEITSNPVGVFMGTNTFENNTDQSQKISTNSFKKTVKNTLTTSVTKGISITVGANYKFFNNELKFNYSKTDTQTKTTTIEITAPSQTLTIPPHSKYKINIYLGQNTSKMNLNLNARISGIINCTITYNYNYTQNFSVEIPTALSFLDSLPEGISIDWATNQVVFNGAAMVQNTEENNSFSVKVEKIF